MAIDAIPHAQPDTMASRRFSVNDGRFDVEKSRHFRSLTASHCLLPIWAKDQCRPGDDGSYDHKINLTASDGWVFLLKVGVAQVINSTIKSSRVLDVISDLEIYEIWCWHDSISRPLFCPQSQTHTLIYLRVSLSLYARLRMFRLYETIKYHWLIFRYPVSEKLYSHGICSILLFKCARVRTCTFVACARSFCYNIKNLLLKMAEGLTWATIYLLIQYIFKLMYLSQIFLNMSPDLIFRRLVSINWFSVTFYLYVSICLEGFIYLK